MVRVSHLVCIYIFIHIKTPQKKQAGYINPTKVAVNLTCFSPFEGLLYDSEPDIINRNLGQRLSNVII